MTSERGEDALADGPEQDATGADAVPFDPTGLDLARSIADAVANVGLPPAAKPRKPRRRQKRSSGRSGSDPTALGDALGDMIADEGWSTQVGVHALLGRWPAIVGDVVGSHSHPERFADGVVTIRTDSTAWASQLRLMAPQLLAKLNEALGDGTITRLDIIGPDAPSWKHGIRAVQGWGGPRDTYG